MTSKVLWLISCKKNLHITFLPDLTWSFSNQNLASYSMKWHKITLPRSVIYHSLGWLSWHLLWVSSCYTIRPKGTQRSQATKTAAVESTVVIGPMPMPKACSNWNADVRLGTTTWHVGRSESANQVGWQGFSSYICPEIRIASLKSLSFFKRLTDLLLGTHAVRTFCSFWFLWCDRSSGRAKTKVLQGFLLLYLKSHHWEVSQTTYGQKVFVLEDHNLGFLS